MAKYYFSRGFTLVELLTAIGILSVLSIMALVGTVNVLERSKVAQTVDLVRKVESAARQYYADTGQWPPTFIGADTGDVANNLLITEPVTSIPGWNGPYMSGTAREHPWKGQLGWSLGDVNGDGVQDLIMVLGSSGIGEEGQMNAPIPTDLLSEIDKKVDDGNLSTGSVRGPGSIVAGYTPENGELFIIIY